ATLFRLPGVRNTVLGEASDQFLEGAKLQEIGRGLVGGDLYSPFIGAKLLTNRDPETRAEDGSRPLLNTDIGERASVFVSSPRWQGKNGDKAEQAPDNDERIERYQGVRGEFRPRRPMNGDDLDEEIVEGSVGRRRAQTSGAYTLSELESVDD